MNYNFTETIINEVMERAEKLRKQMFDADHPPGVAYYAGYIQALEDMKKATPFKWEITEE